MNLSPVFRQRFFDSNGAPLVGGLLYSYAAGTTTPQATYSNAAGTTNTNPVVLDASGYADVWLDPALAYKFVLEDANSSVLWTEDNVTYAVGITNWNASSVYAQGAIVVDSSGQGLLYVSLTSGNVGNALTNTSFWRIFSGNVRSVTANTTLTVTDDLVRSNSTSLSLTHTLPACSTTPTGKRITVIDIGSGSHTTTVKGSGTDTVDGANSYATALKQYDSLTVENNGTSWDIVSGFMLPDGYVTAAKIANATITATQIANSTVTGAQMANSVNLPGANVQVASQNVVVANTNEASNPSILRGYCNSNATVARGSGFNVVKNGGLTGHYVVTFNTPFTGAPIVVVCPSTAGTNPIFCGIVTPVNVNQFGVETYNSSGTAVDADFMFIAIGLR